MRQRRASIERYRHLGIPGELSLEFFNNRLMQANFEPEAAAPYNDRLLDSEKARLKRTRVGKAEWNDGTLRIATNVEYAASEVGRSAHATPYVVWEDVRLAQQRREWEEAFGSIAVRARE